MKVSRSRNWTIRYGVPLVDDLGHFLNPLELTHCNEDSWEYTTPEIKFIKKREVLYKKDFSCDSLKILAK